MRPTGKMKYSMALLTRIFGLLLYCNLKVHGTVKIYEFDQDNIGITIEHGSNGLGVAAVRGQAADLGVEINDSLLALNGMPIDSLERHVVYEMIRNLPRPLAIRFDRPPRETRQPQDSRQSDHQSTLPLASTVISDGVGPALLQTVLSLLHNGKHSEALTHIDAHATSLITAPSGSGIEEDLAIRLAVIRGWLLEQLGHPDSGAEWVRSMHTKFPNGECFHLKMLSEHYLLPNILY